MRPRRGPRGRAVAVVLLVASALGVPAAARAALDVGSAVQALPLELPVCPNVLPGTVRCTSVLLTDQRAWSAAVAASPNVGGVLGLLTTTTVRRKTTTTTAKPTTTSSTSTTKPSTTTTSTSTSTTLATTTTTTSGTHRGFGPADLRAAYGLTSAASTGGSGQTVAIVDPYDHPNAEADLGVYRSYYGLPACTTANGCFRKVDERGGTAYPAGNATWDQEIALDIEMVSAACPNCHILLVEADSVADSDINAAENKAAALGAAAISNSFVAPDTADNSAFHHAGVAITAASGDDAQVNFPASSNGVTAVGGTTLTKATNTRGWTETAWSGSGSGCANYAAKPSWQHDSGCGRRTIADVAAVADPKTGVAAYDSV